MASRRWWWWPCDSGGEHGDSGSKKVAETVAMRQQRHYDNKERWHGDNEEVTVTVAGPVASSDIDTATSRATYMVSLMLYNNIALYLHL